MRKAQTCSKKVEDEGEVEVVNPPEEVQRQKGVNLKYVNSSAQVKVPSPKSTTTQSPVNVPIGSYLVNRINI